MDIQGKDKEALYEVFHPTLRQNLERAERYTLEVKQEEGWERFYDLYTATMQRHKLRPWHKEYIKTLRETLVPLGVCEIWSVYYNGELLSSNLYILFNGRATHLFGGSSDAKREVMGPHFLHAHMMSVFADRGMGKYDLGKVDREKLPGLTTFKTRFGGTTHTYPGNVKNIVRPVWYRLYTLLKTLR